MLAVMHRAFSNRQGHGRGLLRNCARGLAWACLMAAALTLGCADRTALRLVIRSNLAVPTELDGLLIQMRSSTGASAPARAVTLTSGGFPQTLVVRPEGSGMRGIVTFTVQGLRSGSIVIQRVVSRPFESGQVIDVEVELNDDCVGVECGPGIDCIRGVCATAPPDAGMERPDAGTLVDASRLDAFFFPDASIDAFESGPDALSDDAFALAPDAFALAPDAFSRPDATAPVDAFSSPDAFLPRDAFSVPDAHLSPDSGIGCVGAGCAGVVLISEFTHTGPAGGLDEILEIYNTSDRTVDIGGAQVFYTSASGGSRSGRATVPMGTRLPPGGFFLFAGSGYSVAPMPDATAWTMGASDSGGSWSLEHGGTVLDRVCWGTAVASICEGTALAPLSPSSSGSYERKANATSTAPSMSSGADASAGNRHDTNDNGADFVLRATREPQSRASTPEP
jgi:hypothetical protein